MLLYHTLPVKYRQDILPGDESAQNGTPVRAARESGSRALPFGGRCVYCSTGTQMTAPSVKSVGSMLGLSISRRPMVVR